MGLEDFIGAMVAEYERHYPEKGDSWKTCDVGYLENKLWHVYLKWSQTGHIDELVDMANMAAMVWIRSSNQKVNKNE